MLDFYEMRQAYLRALQTPLDTRNKMTSLDKAAYPVGLMVAEVRMLTKEELKAEGWENSRGGYPVAIIFNDGSKIYASSDPEGNNVGCIFGVTSDGETIIVSPLEDVVADNN
jgi:hypothetical protein